MCRRKGGLTPGSCLGRIPAWTRQIHCKVNRDMWMACYLQRTNKRSSCSDLDLCICDLIYIQSSIFPGSGRSSTTRRTKLLLSNSDFQSLSGWLSMAAESLPEMNTWARWSQSFPLPRISHISYISHIYLFPPIYLAQLLSSTVWSPPTGRLTMRNALPAPNSPLLTLFSQWRTSRWVPQFCTHCSN